MHAGPKVAGACLLESVGASGRKTYPRSSRLTAASDYAAALNSRCRKSAHWFSAHVIHSVGPSARLGLTVPKRLVARAVKRNQIKRLVRESFRLRSAGLGAVDVVIRLRRVPHSADLADVRMEVDRLFDWIATRTEEEC